VNNREIQKIELRKEWCSQRVFVERKECYSGEVPVLSFLYICLYMAKILFTAFMADARGKVAGSVFSRNRAGGYVRTKVTPVNPQTTYQSGVRSRLTGNSQAWRGLTAAQRSGWNTGAINFPKTDIFGNQQILSGQQLYTGLNNNLLNTGTSTISTIPTPQAVGAITSATLTMAAGAQTASLAFAPTPVPTSTTWLIFATPGISPGKTFVRNLYKQIKTIAAGSATPNNIAAAYIARYGAVPVAGQQVFLRIIPISTISGQSGQSYEISTIVAA